MILVWMAVAGGLGAAVRFLFDGFVRSRVKGVPSVGTLIINVTGALGLAMIAGLVASRVVPESTITVVGTGFLGGYTTFSTTSFETVRLIQRGRRSTALAMVLIQMIAFVLAAVAGYALGVWL